MSKTINVESTESSTPPAPKGPGFLRRGINHVSSFERSFSDDHPVVGTAIGVGLFTGGAALAAPVVEKAVDVVGGWFGRGAEKAAEEVASETTTEATANFAAGGGRIRTLLGF